VSAASKTTQSVVSPGETAFLIEFSVALHKHAMYPTGHQSLEPAAARVAERAARLLENRPTLAFGVARHQLIIEGIATDPNHPVLRRLAETLHQHHLGAVSILRGVESHEISGALLALAEEVSSGTALGLTPGGRVPEWPHVRLHPLTLDRLELVEEHPSTRHHGDGERVRRRAQLWIGLANAAMARDWVAQSDTAPPDPASVAKAIDHHAGSAAYDQVVIGYLLQIADELKNDTGADQAGLRRRTARLIRALRPETLQRLVEMGGDAEQRKTFVLGMTSGMAVDSVVKVVKAAAAASGQTISHGLLRMLTKLATHVEAGGEQARPIADSALREQIDRLLSGWSLDDPSPGGYTIALQHLATRDGSGTRPVGRSDSGADALRVVEISLEVGGAGPLVERAIDDAIDAGHLRALLALLSSLPPECGDAADILRHKVGGAGALSRLVQRDPLDLETLDALLPSLSIDGYEVLLDALITTGNRATRRKLLERLAPTRLDVAPLVAARLEDQRWYVLRNLLLLMERLRQLPPGFSATRWAQHPDPRVRYQGLALQLTFPDERESGLRAALEDADQRITRLGLRACQDDCPRTLLPLIANVATNPQISDDLRIHAVTLLGRSHERQALGALIRLVHGGTTMLGRPKLGPRSLLLLQALRALREWASDADASQFLALARRSSDPDIRQAAEGVGV